MRGCGADVRAGTQKNENEVLPLLRRRQRPISRGGGGGDEDKDTVIGGIIRTIMIVANIITF